MHGCKRFAYFFDESYREPMRICISPAAVIAAIIIAFITIRISAWIPSKRATKITAVEAIRQSADIKQKKHIKKPNTAVPGFVVYYTNYSIVATPSLEDVQLV